MDKKVTIKIKSPSASYPDLEFVCDVTNTVMDVKDRISREFPTQPSVSAQKLVYSGKILKDSDRLEDVLRFDEDVTKYTLHLVCAIPQKKTSTETEPVMENAFPDGLRQRHAGASTATNTGTDMDQMMREFSDQYSDAMASMTANPSEAEMVAMQELYSQYMSLYMQYVQSQSPLQQQSPVFIPNQQQVPVQADNLPQDGGPGAAAAGAPGPDAPGGLVMNAGAAAGQIQDEGGVGQRDILDWVYVITRVMLLTSVIYFHSSFLRLAFVAGLGFLVYLYQNQNRAGQQLRRQQQQQQQQAEQPQQPPQRDEGERTEEGEDQEHVEEAVEVLEEPAPSKLAVIVTFLTTLVSSIIPEQPQVI